MRSIEDIRGKGKKKIIGGIVEAKRTSLDLYNGIRVDNIPILL